MNRFSFEAFQRYEPYIAQAVHVLPSEFKFNTRQPPLRLSPETVAARMRDAMRALSNSTWITCVNHKKFNEYYPQLEVAIVDDSHVAIRLKSTRRKTANSVSIRNFLDVRGHSMIVDKLLPCISAGELDGLEIANSGRTFDEWTAILNPLGLALVQNEDTIVIV